MKANQDSISRYIITFLLFQLPWALFCQNSLRLFSSTFPHDSFGMDDVIELRIFEYNSERCVYIKFQNIDRDTVLLNIFGRLLSIRESALNSNKILLDDFKVIEIGPASDIVDFCRIVLLKNNQIIYTLEGVGVNSLLRINGIHGLEDKRKFRIAVTDLNHYMDGL